MSSKLGKVELDLGNIRLPWIAKHEHGSRKNSIIKCIPIAKLIKSRMVVGLSDKGRWVRIRTASAAVFREQEPFFLPVLETPFHEVRDALQSGLRAQRLAESIEIEFPYEEICILGLASGSEHWVQLALDRAPSLPPSTRLIEALRSTSLGAPKQTLRHSAKKKMAQFRRALQSARS